MGGFFSTSPPPIDGIAPELLVCPPGQEPVTIGYDKADYTQKLQELNASIHKQKLYPMRDRGFTG